MLEGISFSCFFASSSHDQSGRIRNRIHSYSAHVGRNSTAYRNLESGPLSRETAWEGLTGLPHPPFRHNHWREFLRRNLLAASPLQLANLVGAQSEEKETGIGARRTAEIQLGLVSVVE